MDKTLKKLVLLLAAVMCLHPLYSMAGEESRISTKYTVIDGADGYYIAKDRTGACGLLDSDGETAVDFEYEDMVFPEGTAQYDFIKVKQGAAWGILDYSGEEIVPLSYRKVSEFKDGNEIAAAYNGNKTDLYNLKGKKQKNQLSGDYTKVLSDTVFVGEEDIRNERDNVLIDLKEEGLVTSDPDDDSKLKSVVDGNAEFIAAQYYCTGDGETFGKLKADQYIKVFNAKGDHLEDVVPNSEWTSEEEDTIKGSLVLKKAISDDSILVNMEMEPEDKDDFSLIYTISKEKYSEKFKSVGTFTDNHAFAIDMDDELIIIDEKGEEISDGEITIENYKREKSILPKKADTLKPAFVRFKKDDKIKLYSLLNDKAVDEEFKEVIFKNNGYVLVGSDDDKYAVLDNKGKKIIPYGEYEKDELNDENQTFYSETGVVVVKQSGEKSTIYSYGFTENEKKSGFIKEHKLMVFIICAAAILLIILIVLLVLRNRKKKEEAERAHQEELIRQQQEKKKAQERRRLNQNESLNNIRKESVAVQRQQVSPSGYIKGVRGEYAGALIRIKPGESVRIGRSQEGNDLILNNAKVSRQHCMISYDAVRKEYHVKDFSYNGVYTSTGKKLTKDTDNILREGTVLFIGNEENAFELGNRR